MATKPKIYKSEKDVKAQIKKLLIDRNWFIWMPPANGFGKVGISDVHALCNGVFMAVEAKFGGNKPSPHQKAFLESVIACTAFGVVVDETTIGVFETFLDVLDKSHANVLASLNAGESEKTTDVDGAALLDAIRILTAPIVAGKG